MPSRMRFALRFSGHEIFDQARMATELLAQLSPAEHRERVRLLAILAAAKVFVDPEAAADAADRAAQEADRAGDEVSRAWRLLARCVADVSPLSVEARRTDSREVLRIAEATGATELVTTAFFLHLSALAELGRIAEMDLALSATGPFLSAFPWLEGERHVAWFRCLRATIDGQAEAAEGLADRAFALAQQEQDPDAQSVWVGQLAIIRWMQGRVVELEDAFLRARQSAPHEPIWAVSLAWMWLRQGRRSAARSLVTSLPPFAEHPLDRNWIATACILAETAAELEEHGIAAVVRAALEPFEGRLATIGLGVTCWGTVSRPLALVAALSGDTDAAIEHYRRAIAFTGGIGAHAWLAEAQRELGALLAERGLPGDREEAVALAMESAATGRALRLHGPERAASTLLASLRAPAELLRTPERALAEPSRPRIAVLGAFEVFAADGTLAKWQSRKARQLLKILVARRGIAISRESLMHLLWPDEAPQKVANRLSVATTAVRRALDPHGSAPSDAYVKSSGSAMRLGIELLDIDLEQFLTETRDALAELPLDAEAAARLTETLQLHQGDALADEPDAPWAQELRNDVHVAFFGAAHALAEAAQARGDELTRLECYRRVLAVDGYDQRAHEGFIDALVSLGAHGQAMTARAAYAERMRELALPAADV